LAEAVEPLDRLDDAELMGLARVRLPHDVSTELQSLHLKQQQSGLTTSEQERSEELCLQYDRTMLIRARSAMLLKERGHDIASLLANP
jgi:hypothetical protein